MEMDAARVERRLLWLGMPSEFCREVRRIAVGFSGVEQRYDVLMQIQFALQKVRLVTKGLDPFLGLWLGHGEMLREFAWSAEFAVQGWRGR